MSNVSSRGQLRVAEVPGEYPYMDWAYKGGSSPTTVEQLCDRCGTCAAVCPVGAIVVGDEVETDKAKCIMFLACIKYCPMEARTAGDTWVKRAGEWLSERCSKRLEPEVYL